MSGIERRFKRALPAPLRARAALRTARALVRATYPGSRAIIHMKRGTASIDLRGSLFCEVREASVLPLCGFYASAIAGCCTCSGSRPMAGPRCRASGSGKGCRLRSCCRPAGSERAVA
jgi:hypothetical protein